MKRILGIFSVFALALSASQANADVIMFEDFEDAVVNYTTSHADAFGSQGANDYYGRIGPGGGTLTSGDVVYGNPQGSGYYGVQDTDAASGGGGPTNSIDMDFSIDISGYVNLGLQIFVAEDDAVSGEDWDTDTSLLIEYQIDGGGFINLLAFESEIGTDGNQTNEKAREDTNFDTIGDGTELTAAFTQFSKSIAGTGTTLDLRINFVAMNAGDEDVAIDSVRVTGSVPEPGTAGLIGLAMFGFCFVRRRK